MSPGLRFDGGASHGGEAAQQVALGSLRVRASELARTVRDEERLTSALIPVGSGLLVGVLS